MPVVAVAAAVLLAGGGGAYWAATAGPDGSGAAPPPLALDGVQARQAASGQEKAGAGGIAPGEPAGAPRLKAAGELPEGPESARVQRPAGAVERAQVAALAEALDLSGTPKKQDGRWTVGPERDGARLTVDAEAAGGSWRYTDESAGGDGGPVPAEEAERAVRPAVRALGADGAEVGTERTVGPARQVTVAPEVGGLPTYQWGGSFMVGPDGRVGTAHGELGRLETGDSYPVMSAEETLKQLNSQRARPGSGAGAGQAAEPASASSGFAGQLGKREPARVESARFGLAARESRGEPVLVPSWIYEVKLPGGGGTARVAHPAVEPEHLEPGAGAPSGDASVEVPGTPPKPSASRPPAEGDVDPAAQAVDTYRAEGRTLKLTFWAGVCDTYTASAKETEKSVEVKVRPENPDEKKVCVKMAKRQTLEVRLDAELGERKVVDARDGEELPRSD
ncbi:hypothetical protein HCC30_10545 [Streptomyces sp. HNM0574]|nr:hypothetical protein [Streptomyces sp. HNM0574]NLU67705.1 hypothetical protein [Streptomyces sp. HNM0574]